MTAESVMTLGQQAMMTTLYVAGPMLAVALMAGLVIGMLQALTSVHEQTLSYIPKLIAVLGVMLLLMPWMLTHLMVFAARLLSNLPMYAR